MTEDRKLEPGDRKREVERFIYDRQWDHLEQIDDWSGEDLEDLRAMMTEEEFQSVLDHLEENVPEDER